MTENLQRWRSRLICLGLAAGVAAVYWPVRHFEFINFDDQVYVTDNPHVRAGLTGESVLWAFTTCQAEFWHPLTWLSHMLDWQLYGANAGGHHATSVLLHIANTLLLFGVMRRLTGATWRSAWVAALFGLHPLHVESVAWVAERKDVLSTCFGLLTLWAYSRYAEHRAASVEQPAGRKRWYGLALVFFILGLMAKPMVVTLPLVLLLLDWWPLGRWEPFAVHTSRAAFLRLVREKVPFLALAAGFGVVTFWAQRGAGSLPAGIRAGNVVVSYVRYLGKTVWPEELAVFYPYRVWPWWAVAGAAVLLAGVTAAVLWRARREPWLAVGWFWYVGTLVPVIGLMQVGSHALADRYTYMPLIGLLVLVAWGVPAWCRRVGEKMATVTLSGCVVVCGVLSGIQVRHWKDSETLFRHALAVTTANYLAHNNLGFALTQAGRMPEAMMHLEKALQINPEYADAHDNLGVALFKQGKIAEAIGHYEQALRFEPESVEAHNNLGAALVQQGKLAEAIGHYEQALRIKPAYTEAHYNLGTALFKQGKVAEAIGHLEQRVEFKPEDAEAHYSLGTALFELGKVSEAVEHLERTLRSKPDDAKAHMNLGIALFQLDRVPEAIGHLEQALRLQPGDAEGYNNLGAALIQQGRAPEAIGHLEQALRLKPEYADAHYNLGKALLRLGRVREAIEQYEQTLRLKPDDAGARIELAWVLATCADASVRNSAQAVELAEGASRSTGGKEPAVLDTLAAAYAEAGRFDDAVRTVQTALELAKKARQADKARQIEGRLKLYQTGRPYREGSTPTP